MGKNGVEVMVVNGIKWVNENHIKEGLDHANLPVRTRKYHSTILNIDMNY